jgi:hypothetical protein
VPAALLSILFLGLHLVVRFTAPYADPVLIPAVALVNGWAWASCAARPGQGDRRQAARAGLLRRHRGRQLAWTLASLILAGGACCWWFAITRSSRGTPTPWAWSASCW